MGAQYDLGIRRGTVARYAFVDLPGGHTIGISLPVSTAEGVTGPAELDVYADQAQSIVESFHFGD